MDHDWNNTSDTNRTNNRHGSSSLALSQHATDMPQGPLNEDFKFFLASLDFATTAGDVREWISTRFGEVNFMKIIYGPDGKSRGFGFLYMSTAEGSAMLEEVSKIQGGKFEWGRKTVHLRKDDGRRKRDSRACGDSSDGNANSNNRWKKQPLRRHSSQAHRHNDFSQTPRHVDTNIPQSTSASNPSSYEKEASSGVPHPPNHVNYASNKIPDDTGRLSSSTHIYPPNGHDQGRNSALPVSAQNYSNVNAPSNVSGLGLAGQQQRGYTQTVPAAAAQQNIPHAPHLGSGAMDNTNVTPHQQQPHPNDRPSYSDPHLNGNQQQLMTSPNQPSQMYPRNQIPYASTNVQQLQQQQPQQ